MYRAEEDGHCHRFRGTRATSSQAPSHPREGAALVHRKRVEIEALHPLHDQVETADAVGYRHRLRIRIAFLHAAVPGDERLAAIERGALGSLVLVVPVDQLGAVGLADPACAHRVEVVVGDAARRKRYCSPRPG